MLRFFSKRVSRNAQKYKNVNEAKVSARAPTGKPNKNLLPCTVTLLDQTDLSFELPVSLPFFLIDLAIITLIECTEQQAHITPLSCLYSVLLMYFL